MFAYKKNIYGNYYLIEGDTRDNISLAYKNAVGDYEGRIPSRMMEYAVVADSLLIAKSKQGAEILYYVLNIKRDTTYANKEKYLTGPFTEKDFSNWREKEKTTLNFIKVK